MHSAVPAPAAKLLDFIGSKEAPKGYDTVFGNNQAGMAKKITQMTLDEVIADGKRRTSAYGSSAAGRYQFMRNTLIAIKNELKLKGTERFDPDFQDDLGWYLLRRRGYDKWVKGELTTHAFMVRLAQEWASFPVPYAMKGAHRHIERGDSYYKGDSLNKALVGASEVEIQLRQAFALRDAPQPSEVLVAKTQPAVVKDSPSPAAMTMVEQLWAWALNGFRRVS